MCVMDEGRIAPFVIRTKAGMWGVLSKQGIWPNLSLTKITLAAAGRTDYRGAALEAVELSGGH